MRVLVVDDDPAHAALLCGVASRLGHDVHRHSTVGDVLATNTSDNFSLAFICMDPAGEDGLTLLDLPELAGADVVLMSDSDDHARVNQGITRGATWFFRKPVDPEFVEELVTDIAAEETVRTRAIGNIDKAIGQFALLRGGSPRMRNLFRTMRKIAPLDTSVLIVGESGVGKELVAQSLHMLSSRARNELIPLNCAAIPRDLFESELFGHEKGSFSGAIGRHVGLFERAHRGTLFLDEITEMPTELQAKLLRVLEVNSFRRVGGEQDIQCDVRILASSNREPADAINDGLLRQDLYFRLARFQVSVPPLRDRGEDIAGLARFFLNELNEKHEMAKTMSDEAIEVITSYPWPGNVRELQSVIERAFILCNRGIRAANLKQLRRAPLADGERIVISLNATIAEAEKTLILAVLEEYDGNKNRAAESLGISLKTLYNRLHEYGQNG